VAVVPEVTLRGMLKEQVEVALVDLEVLLIFH
jgi:hypothetical protein